MKIFRTVVLATSFLMSITAFADQQTVIEKAAEHSVKTNTDLFQQNMALQLTNDIRLSLRAVRVPLDYKNITLLTKNKLSITPNKKKQSEE